MSLEEVIKKFEEIFIDVLENDEINLSFETTADDIDEWDSINHISLIVEIEEEFSLKFSASDIRGFANVGEMCQAVMDRKEWK